MKRIMTICAVFGLAASLSACGPTDLLSGGGLMASYSGHITGDFSALGSSESEILRKDVVTAGYTEDEAKLVIDTVEKALLGGKRPEKAGVKLAHVESVTTPIIVNVADEMDRFELQLDRAGKPLAGDCNGVRHGIHGFVEKDGSRSVISGAWCRWSGKADWSAVKPFMIEQVVAQAPAKPEPAKAKKAPTKKKAAV